jgi:hypothetical protein
MEMALTSASSAASVGRFLVDLISILKFVPGATFQKKARIGRKLQEEFRERPYVASIESMVSQPWGMSKNMMMIINDKR